MVEDSARSRDCNRMLLGIWFAWMHRASFPFVANDTGASIASLCTVPVPVLLPAIIVRTMGTSTIHALIQRQNLNLNHKSLLELMVLFEKGNM